MKKVITTAIVILVTVIAANAQTSVNKTVKSSSTVTEIKKDSVTKTTKYDRFIGKCAKGQTFIVNASTIAKSGETCVDVIYDKTVCCETIQIDDAKFKITNVYEREGKIKAAIYNKATGDSFEQLLAEL